MATQDYAASVQGVALRVTRLDVAGNLLNGPLDSYTTSSFIRVSFTPEYEEGDEITEKGADGTVCVTFKAPDTLKRTTMEIAICDPDPEFTALVSGGTLLTRQTTVGEVTSTKSVGWAAAPVGADPSGNGVAVEVWSYAVQGGKKAPTFPYFHWVFPYVKVRQSGDRVIENGLLANTFEGFGLGNINFDSGPDTRWAWPAVADRPYMFGRADWAPLGYKGFYTWTDDTAEGVPTNTLTAEDGEVSERSAAPINFLLPAAGDSVTDDGVTSAIAAISPGSGVVAGGNDVVITGNELSKVTKVLFDGEEAEVKDVTSNKITATVPGAKTKKKGAVDVTLVTDDGEVNLPSGYNYGA